MFEDISVPPQYELSWFSFNFLAPNIRRDAVFTQRKYIIQSPIPLQGLSPSLASAGATNVRAEAICLQCKYLIESIPSLHKAFPFPCKLPYYNNNNNKLYYCSR